MTSGEFCICSGTDTSMCPFHDVLGKYRRIMDAIHKGGNIFANPDRYEAYKIIAILASDERQRQRHAKNSQQET